MMHFECPALSMTLDRNGTVVELRVPGGENLIREPKPFAELAFFPLQPAFTNEWVHPIHIEEPEYGVFSALEDTPDGFLLRYTRGSDRITLDFSVESVPEALIVTLNRVESDGERPARIRFAQLSLITDADTAATGMALDPIVEGVSLPGIVAEQSAQAYDRTGFSGRRWALTGAPKSELRERMQAVTRRYTRDIPWLSTAGAFAEADSPVQGSYMMVYGAYLPGSLAPQNLEEWIPMLHAIGLTQVDFHGAEDKNFSFGDFQPNRAIFPEGRKSMKEMVDRLHAEGIGAILHTYSALIGPASSMVTPVPDRNLGYNRVFTLTADVSADDTELPILEDVAEISLVHTGHYNSSTYVIWDDEIIQFTALGEHSLKGCIRGALGTHAAAHAAGTPGRNLKRKYNIFAPDVGGPLFDRVARETAACANECGFDGYYFDALEGAEVLEGSDLRNYWCTRFVYDVARYTGRPVGMEMSTMHHGLWYTRSRMGAWDRPSRAHKQFLLRHAEVNSRAQARHLLPQNLGWWYMGTNLPSNASEWERMTTDVFDTMGRLSAAYNFSMSFQGLTVQAWKSSEELRRIGDRIRRWEKLRLSGVLTEEERAAIACQECRMQPDGIYAAAYPEAVAQLVDGQAELCIDNPFGEQQPMLLRLEPLHTRASEPGERQEVFDINDMVAPGAVASAGKSKAASREVYPFDGIRARDLLCFTSRTVTASASDEDSPYGPALCLTAQAQRDIGAARFERRFENHLNITGQYGCGVWVYGDGKGEILNLQLRSPLLFSRGLDEKIVTVDFTGWRYFELIEASSAQTMRYLWPYYHRQLDTKNEFAPVGYEAPTSDWPDSMYLTNHLVEGNPSHITAHVPDYAHISYAAVWLNNLPKGETCQVKIAGWHRFFTKPCTLSDITVEAASGTVRVEGSLAADCIVEYSDSVGAPGLGEAASAGAGRPSWFSSDRESACMDDCRASGMITLQPGRNSLRIRAAAPDGARIRLVCGVQEDTPLIAR